MCVYAYLRMYVSYCENVTILKDNATRLSVSRSRTSENEQTLAVQATVKVFTCSPLYLEHARGTRAVPERVFLTRHASRATLADVVARRRRRHRRHRRRRRRRHRRSLPVFSPRSVRSIVLRFNAWRRFAHARNLPMCR